MNFLTSSPKSAPFKIKTQRNGITCMQLTSPKVHLPQTIHDWHRPLRIVLYHAIIHASFSKRTPMTVYVSNKQVSSRQAYIYTLIYIGDQGIVYLLMFEVEVVPWRSRLERQCNKREVVVSSLIIGKKNHFVIITFFPVPNFTKRLRVTASVTYT